MFKNFKATPEQWRRVDRWANQDGSSSDTCILELRARVERLEEMQSTVEESPAPVATDDELQRCFSQAVTDSIQRGATNQELCVAARRAIYDLGRQHAHIQAARVECLRRALIGVITVCGGIASEDVSDDFLCRAPDEVLACLKKPRYRYSPVTIAECGGPCEQGPEHCDCGEIKPEPAPAPAGSLVERVAGRLNAACGLQGGQWDEVAIDVLREVAAAARAKGSKHWDPSGVAQMVTWGMVAQWLEQEAGQ